MWNHHLPTDCPQFHSFILLPELQQSPSAQSGPAPGLRERRHQGADVAQRERGRGGQLRLERPQLQHGRQEGQLLSASTVLSQDSVVV